MLALCGFAQCRVAFRQLDLTGALAVTYGLGPEWLFRVPARLRAIN